MHSRLFYRIEETNSRHDSGRLPRLLLCLLLALAATSLTAQTNYTPYTVITWAGAAGITGTNDGTGSAASFSNPAALTTDASGNVFVVDFTSNTIRQVTSSRVVTTIAGLGGTSGTNDGIGAAARFSGPNGVAVDGAGNLYVTDRGNNTVRKLSSNGTSWAVTTLAGLPGTAGSEDGTGNAARFNGPGSLALDNATNLYVADAFNNTIRKVTPAGVVTTIAGLAETSGTNDGMNSTARFFEPDRVALDSAGNVYVADYGNSTIRKITPVGTNWVVTTIAGLAGNPGSVDGTNSDARIYHPEAVAVDSAGNLYVGEGSYGTLRKITPVGTNWVVTTIAGLAGNPGNADGTGSAARFASILGVAVDSVGDLFIADARANKTIRKAWSSAGGARPAITAQPASSVLVAGSDAAFSADVIGSGFLSYQWQFNGTNILGATIAAYTRSNAQPADAGSYSVIITNFVGSVTSSIASLGLVYSQPVSQTVNAGDNAVFSVAVAGTGLQFQWRFNGTRLAGATSTALSLTNVSNLNMGFYTVVVSNTAGSVTSAPAFLDVRYALAYGNGGLLLGSNYTFIGSVDLQLWSVFPNGSIFYTLDGSKPSFASNYYAGPFNLNRSATLRVIAYSADFLQAAESPPIFFTVIPTYALNLTSPGGGTVTASPPVGPYVSNTVVTLTPQPSNGWTFLEWRGDVSGASPTVTLTMSRAKTVQAIFGTTLGTTVAGNGAVNVYPSLPLYPHGTVARLTAIPQAGNYFAVWGNAASGSTNPLYFTVTSADPTVSSLFATLGVNQQALTVTPDGFGRVTITPRANVYATGTSVSLNATPDPGQQFLAWSGDAAGTQNPLPISMNTSKSITGTFTRKPALAVAPPLGGLFEDGFRLTLMGEFGLAYRIDASTNLTGWAPLTVLSNAYGTVQFIDDSATNAAVRFYRASDLTP